MKNLILSIAIYSVIAVTLLPVFLFLLNSTK